jgi:Peptidase_C39 like family
MDSFNLDKVPWYSQKDNAYQPHTSCFPTSLAMCMRYCLDIEGKTKTAVGCSELIQLEDYIFQCLEDPETKAWIKTNISRLGYWVLQYAPRYVYTIEAYIFNRLMNPLGYKATFRDDLTYSVVCDWIETKQLPVVLGGNFSSVSKVSGHMNCCTGFNKIGIKEFIINDPYGNALTGYAKSEGAGMRYSFRFYMTDSYGHMNGVVFEKIS